MAEDLGRLTLDGSSFVVSRAKAGERRAQAALGRAPEVAAEHYLTTLVAQIGAA